MVVCHGRPVDDHGRPYGQRCRNRWRPPRLTVGGPWYIAHPLSSRIHKPTVDEVVGMAIAAGWSVTPLGRDCDCPDHEPTDLVGMCPRCRRPTPEATALAKEVGAPWLAHTCTSTT